MRAGGLRYEIEIQHAVERVNTFGERVRTWERFAVTRADIHHINGARKQDIGELVPAYKVEFRIRNYHKVDETMRVLYKGKKYRIEAIIPTDRKAMLTLVTEKINE